MLIIFTCFLDMRRTFIVVDFSLISIRYCSYNCKCECKYFVLLGSVFVKRKECILHSSPVLTNR